MDGKKVVHDLDWVQRRAMRERNLSKDAPDVWQEVLTAIDNCCRSFREWYAVSAKLEKKIQNGHRIVIKVTRNNPPSTMHVQIDFDETVPCIWAARDARSPAQFLVDADEHSSFLKYNGERISVDDFSEIALKDALFAD
jgi:recombination DNA repair RAD52 pathway protein